jgi:hypothetical protein
MTDSPYTIEMLNNEIDGIEETPEVEEEDSYLAGTKAIHDSLNAELNQPSEDLDNSNSEDFDFDPGFDDDDLDFLQSNVDDDTFDYLLNRRKSNVREVDNEAAPVKGVTPLLQGLTNNLYGMFPGLVVTSTTGGKHMKGSRHYEGKAIDIGANSSDKNAYKTFKSNLRDPQFVAQLKSQYDIEDILDEGDHMHIELKQTGGSSLMNRSSYYPDEMSYNPNTAPPKSFVQNYEDNLKAQPYGQLALEDIDRSQTDKLGWMKGVGNLASKGSNLLNMYDNVKGVIGSSVATGVAGLNSILGARTNNQNMYDEYMKQYGEDQSDYKSLPQGIFQNQRKTYLS